MPKRPGQPVDLHRLWSAVARGRKALIRSTVGGLVLALVVAKLIMGNDWQSSALLQYEGDVSVGGIERRSPYALGPAAEALHSRSVLERIREVSGYPGPLFTLANLILFEPDFKASTLRITVTAPTAELAKDFVGNVTDVFLEHHKDRQTRRIELELKRLQNRIKGANAEAAEARRIYNDFLEENDISHLSSDQLSVVDSASQLRLQGELLEAEVRSMEARVESLRSQLSTIPKDVMLPGSGDPHLRAQEVTLQKLAEAEASLSPDHPRVQALREQVAQLGSRSTRRPVPSGSVGPNSAHVLVSRELREAEWALTGLRERQTGLLEMASKAEERLDSLSGVEGEASALLAEVEVNEALLRELSAIEAALEDALENPPSGFVVLDPGSVPDLPVANKMKIVVFGVICMLGLLLGLFFAFRKEFRGLRVRTPSELAFWGEGPVVASTSWPTTPQALDELVAGLDDHVPDAHGSFLLVGATGAEAVYARELTQRLRSDWFREVPQQARTDSEPIRTPPPSGPYPVGAAATGSAKPSTSTALALQPVKLVRHEPGIELDAWEGPPDGQGLRRAARLADRVLVLVRSGSMSVFQIRSIKRRLGRKSGVGYICLDLDDEFQGLSDRVGEVRDFWTT